jgi:hypothetical protein
MPSDNYEKNSPNKTSYELAFQVKLRPIDIFPKFPSRPNHLGAPCDSDSGCSEVSEDAATISQMEKVVSHPLSL